MSRAKLRIKGRVQGVFYRQKTREQASTLGLTGWVRNVSDGSVEAEVCGPRHKVETLIEWCRKGPSLAYVESVDIDWIAQEDEKDWITGKFQIQ